MKFAAAVPSIGSLHSAFFLGDAQQPPLRRLAEGFSTSNPLWTIIGTVLGAAIAGMTGVLTARYSARQQRESTARTLDTQRKINDRNLESQRADRLEKLGQERVRLLNERFTAAARLLGDEQPAVRLAGVHAMAALADDWVELRQTCVNVLCAYLRVPYAPEPGEKQSSEEHVSWQAGREVRHAIVGVIRKRLLPGANTPWSGLDFDFSGASFDRGSFAGAHFTGGRVSFNGCRFIGMFSFNRACFSGSEVSFVNAHFDADIFFTKSSFIDGNVTFVDAHLSGKKTSFDSAAFAGGNVLFNGANFAGEEVFFDNCCFTKGKVSFNNSQFSDGKVSFTGAQFTGARVSFTGARFTGTAVVDLRDSAEWVVPPAFDDSASVPRPAGLLLPPEGSHVSGQA